MKGKVLEMKHVYCLYRVSTLKQIEGNDIPMQKQACRESVSKKPDWGIRKEFIEKGVSGFKTSAKDRDVIQDLQKATIAKEFDVLLVFMFDRIGRREDETPFVVEWFVQNGIEVWSVEEGQQRFDCHVDKLLNYIHYWQAATFLTSRGILNRAGKNFVSSTIKNMVKNPAYRGVLRSGSSMSEPFDHLRIIDDEIYLQAQGLMEQRSKKNQGVTSSSTITSNDCFTER